MSDPEELKAIKAWKEFEAQLIYRAGKDKAFRRELLENPKALEKEMAGLAEGFKLPEGLIVRVLEQPPGTLILVLPGDELSDDQLDLPAGGYGYPNTLILRG